jgi:WD40 repeat protein
MPLRAGGRPRDAQHGRGVAMSADGSRFATTGEDGTATVWKTDTGKRLLTLHGHDGPVNGAVFSPDGSVLVTAGSDRTVRLWDRATGRQIRVLRGHRGAVLSPAFSPDGTLLATSTARIWEPAGRRSGFVRMIGSGLRPRRQRDWTTAMFSR